jgi:hypothetical protein
MLFLHSRRFFYNFQTENSLRNDMTQSEIYLFIKLKRFITSRDNSIVMPRNWHPKYIKSLLLINKNLFFKLLI